MTTAIEEQLNKLPPIAKRKLVRSMKARFMRDLSERNFQLEDLLQIFGLAIKAKMLERPTRHQMPGKHYGSSHNQRANPTCTKFVRSCIRHSGKESQYSRELYKLLTGLQYGGEADAN